MCIRWDLHSGGNECVQNMQSLRCKLLGIVSYVLVSLGHALWGVWRVWINDYRSEGLDHGNRSVEVCPRITTSRKRVVSTERASPGRVVVRRRKSVRLKYTRSRVISQTCTMTQPLHPLIAWLKAQYRLQLHKRPMIQALILASYAVEWSSTLVVYCICVSPTFVWAMGVH